MALEETQIVVYPNPSTGTFTLQSTVEDAYSIMNELGHLIRVVKLNSTNNYTTTVENLNAGMYLIVGANQNKKNNQKVVITK